MCGCLCCDLTNDGQAIVPLSPLNTCLCCVCAVSVCPSTGRTAFGLTAVRSAMVEWSINVGETCMQLVEGKFISMSGSEGEGGTDR